MSTRIPKTNYRFLEREFEGEILEIRDGANGLPPAAGAVRKTIIFTDHSKLSCQEFIKDDFIDFYHYDLYNSSGVIVMKFHSEPHQEKSAQTNTEPFHWHVREDKSDLKASLRMPILSDRFKELYHIIEFIIGSRYLKFLHVEEQKVETTKKKRR